MIHHDWKPTFVLDLERIDQRLKAPLGRGEFAGLAAAAFLMLGFVYLGARGMPFGIDYIYFTQTVDGDFSQYRYAHWLLPVFALLDALPGYTGFILWGLANILGVWVATRTFGGKPMITLISYQMFYTLFYGQIAGVIAAGLALMWWGIAQRKWEIAGLGLTLALTKLQIGIPVGLTLLMVTNISWYARLRVLLVALTITMISLILYPNWPLKILEGLETVPPDNRGSISFFPLIGALALLFWLPPLVMPMSGGRRVIAMGAAASMALPYFQSNDLIILALFPVGWLGLLGNLGFFMAGFGYKALQFLRIVSITFYVWAVVPPALHWLKKLSTPSAASHEITKESA